MFEKHTDSDVRLRQWRDIRNTAKSEDDVIDAFSTIVPQLRYIDYYTPSEWYNPFEIVADGFFCTTGISIILYHTLANLGYISFEDVSWKVISNHTNGHDGAVFDYNGYYYNVFPGKKIPYAQLDEYATVMKDLGTLKIAPI